MVDFIKNKKVIDLFVTYAETVMTRYKDKVRYSITLMKSIIRQTDSMMFTLGQIQLYYLLKGRQRKSCMRQR